MRLVREISVKEENFRTEPLIKGTDRFQVIKRDPIKPEQEGTIVLVAFRITGYDPDCDGSLMVRMERIHFDDPEKQTGWEVNNIGLYSDTGIVITEKELKELYEKAKESK